MLLTCTRVVDNGAVHSLYGEENKHRKCRYDATDQPTCMLRVNGDLICSRMVYLDYSRATLKDIIV